MEPILTSQGIAYKRNVLLICAIASLSLIEGIDISGAKIFDVQIGEYLWEVGLVLLTYHLVSFIVEARLGWLKWLDIAMKKRPTILQLFNINLLTPYSPDRTKYTQLRLSSINKTLTWRTHYFNEEKKPVMEGDKCKVSSINHCDSSAKYKLMRTQFLQFIMLDILPILIGCCLSLFAYFDH